MDWFTKTRIGIIVAFAILAGVGVSTILWARVWSSPEWKDRKRHLTEEDFDLVLTGSVEPESYRVRRHLRGCGNCKRKLEEKSRRELEEKFRRNDYWEALSSSPESM